MAELAARRHTAQPTRPALLIPDIAHNLPPQPSRLIARDQELAAIRGALLEEGVRLLTLIGPGGSGKTRLAIAAATDVQQSFTGGAWFVDLSVVSAPDLVWPAVARALRLHDPPGGTALSALEDRFSGARHLLVLDNFEHVLEAARAVADLLQRGPLLSVLVTSREPLRLRWEHVFSVPLLEVPDLSQPVDKAVLADTPSVALFVDRARAANSRFDLDETNEQAVAELCVRLDGLPLAIELAAARCRVLSPNALLAHLAGRLPLLASPERDRPARHQALSATIRWSYDLLDVRERALFRWLGIFAGGATAAMAMRVCGANLHLESETATFELLGELAERSLARAVDGPDRQTRFRMLEMVGEFARDELRAQGELEVAERQHALAFLALAEQGQAELIGPRDAEWVARLDAEYDNLRSSVSWALASGESEIALRMCGSLGQFWRVRGHSQEALSWVSQALASSTERVTPAARAKALWVAARLLWSRGDFTAARQHVAECMDLARVTGNRGLLSETLRLSAAIHGDYGDFEGERQLADQALSVAQEAGDDGKIAAALNAVGLAAWARGELTEAAIHLARSLYLRRSLGYRHGIAQGLNNLAAVAREQGDLTRAAMLHEEALELYRVLGHRPGLAYTLACSGHVAVLTGHQARAGALCREAIAVQNQLGEPWGLAKSLQVLALSTAAADGEQATRLFGAVAAFRKRYGLTPHPGERADEERCIGELRAGLGATAFETSFSAGEHVPVDDLVNAVGDPLDTHRQRSDHDHLHAASAAGERRLDSPLSHREREVATLVGKGLTNRQIADALVIAVRTAENHVASIMAKLGFTARAQIAAWAATEGLLTPVTPSSEIPGVARVGST